MRDVRPLATDWLLRRWLEQAQHSLAGRCWPPESASLWIETSWWRWLPLALPATKPLCSARNQPRPISHQPSPPHLHHALSPTSLLQLYLCSAHIFTFKSPIPRFAFKYFFHTKCWIVGNYCSSLSLLRKFRNVSISTWSLGLLVIHLTTLEM